MAWCGARWATTCRRQAEIHYVHIEGLHLDRLKEMSAEYKKLNLGNNSRALDDLAESALQSESDNS